MIEARRGNAGAFEILVRRYTKMAYAVAYSVLASVPDAEDVCQESWIRALERLEECRDPDRFSSWLLQIVRNRARNYREYRAVRSAQSHDETYMGTDSPGERPDAIHERGAERDRLESAISQLSEAQREVVLLHDLVGWSHRAIAEALDVSEVACRQRLFQARVRLRQILGDER
ncbi:MAG: RNA polymerase sigma factor [Candidatus Eisenbacteria bacterium]